MTFDTLVAAARARGLVLDHVDGDGKIHRVPVEGKTRGELPGWYCVARGRSGRWFGTYGRWDDGGGAERWLDDADARPMTQTERDEIDRARRKAKAQRDREQERAATRAADTWARCTESGEAPYLARKGIAHAYGARFEGGSLIVPLRDAVGRLWSLQTIAPDGEKRFLAGGRTRGLFHLIGQAPPPGAWLVLCEGFATGATIHEASRLAVACALNAGNLAPVAEALARRYPKARLLVAADDDRATAERIGTNPGIDKARTAAHAVGARWVKPEGLPEGGSDFNDLAQARGLTEVARQVQASLSDPDAPQAPKRSNDRGTAASTDDDVPEGFQLTKAGLFAIERDREGGEREVWVCSPLRVLANTRDERGEAWGVLLEWPDKAGRLHRWAMPARMLKGDGAEYREVLLDLGLRIGPGQKIRNLLGSYIAGSHPARFARITERCGWHGAQYVLPDRTIGTGEEALYFQSATGTAGHYRQRGTLDEWRERVAARALGNSRLVLALSMAFAAMLLEVVGDESGGVNLRGRSSTGKTKALRAAASVFGGADYVRRWRSTDNALEALAALHSGALLVLDELAQVDPRIAGETAYLLANGQAKARAHRSGGVRPSATWTLLFLSSGEISLAEHMTEAGKRARAGQEVRMLDLPADAGAGLGLFEELHGFESPVAFVEELERATREQYGTAAIAFLEAAAHEFAGIGERVKVIRERFLARYSPEASSGQVHRAAARFAMIAAGGELASRFGVTGWPEGEAIEAAGRCFNDWIAERGSAGDAEEAAMLAQIEEFFERHGEARFSDWERAERGDDHAPRTMLRAGFRRPIFAELRHASYASAENGDKERGSGAWIGTEFFVLARVFTRELCEGFNSREVARVCTMRGILKAGKSGGHTVKRLPGLGPQRCYHFVIGEEPKRG